MKTSLGCGVQLVLLLVLACLLAVPLACFATLTAPLHSPGYAAEVFCPPGSQLKSEWYQATYNRPGERSLSVSCVDAAGNSVPANPRDETALVNGIRLYFPVCFLPIIAIGLIILLTFNGLVRWVRRRRPGKTGATNFGDN